MSKVADVRGAVDAAAGKHQSVAARGRAAVRQAVAALPPAEQPVLQQLLEGLYEAISQEGPDRPFQPPVSAMKAPLWQDACLAYLATCSPAQLSGWRWRVEHDSGVFISSRQAEVEVGWPVGGAWLGCLRFANRPPAGCPGCLPACSFFLSLPSTPAHPAANATATQQLQTAVHC